MNRLGQNDFSRLPAPAIGLVNEAFVAKMRSYPARNEPRRTSIPPAKTNLNPLLTIHAANSAYQGRRARRQRESGSDVHQRSSGAVGTADQDAVASGASAHPRRKRLQLR